MTHTRQFGNVRLLFSVFMLAALALSIFATAAPASAEYTNSRCHDNLIAFPLNLTSTPQILVQGSEDDIYVSRKVDQPTNIVKVVLKSSPFVTWWKGVDILKKGAVIASTYTEGSTHQNSLTFTFDPNHKTDYGIRLMKAKAFGVHTGMYCLLTDYGIPEPDFQWGSNTITFNWEWD